MNNRKITKARNKFTQFVTSETSKVIKKFVHIPPPMLLLIGKPTNPNVIYDPRRAKHFRTLRGSFKKHGENLFGIHGILKPQ
jgi:hypothetical protein